MRGGLLPVVSFSGPALALLLTGTVVVERIFALPGLGNYFINANLNRDEPLIIGIVAFMSIVDPGLQPARRCRLRLHRSADPLLTWPTAERLPRPITDEPVAGTSLWQDAWRRLRRNRLAVCRHGRGRLHRARLGRRTAADHRARHRLHLRLHSRPIARWSSRCRRSPRRTARFRGRIRWAPTSPDATCWRACCSADASR